MPSSFEENKMKALADTLAGNALSSVYIEHNTKGDVWGVKVYNEDAKKAHEIAEEIFSNIKERHA